MTGDLHITGDADTDALLNRDPTALIVGMLLDQQVPLEWAFAGPSTLRRRLGHLDPRLVAELPEDDLVAVCCEKPAVHRFPAAMGRRIHALCSVIAEEYGGDTASIWRDVTSGAELTSRLRALPGFGEEKTMIFVALLAKRFGVRPDGWEPAAGVFADEQPRSIADCHDEASLAAVRDWKRARRAAGRDKQDRPV